MVLFTVFFSVIAAAAIAAFNATTAPADAAVEAARGGVQTTLWIVAVMIPTVGHWLGVLLSNLFHRSEMPLFQNGGWSPTGLALSSWPLTILIGAVYAGVLLLVGV
jgi:hypothetical protein